MRAAVASSLYYHSTYPLPTESTAPSRACQPRTIMLGGTPKCARCNGAVYHAEQVMGPARKVSLPLSFARDAMLTFSSTSCSPYSTCAIVPSFHFCWSILLHALSAFGILLMSMTSTLRRLDIPSITVDLPQALPEVRAMRQASRPRQPR